MTEKIKRSDLWRKQYQEDRYMNGLSDSELDDRFADILTNQIVLTHEGKIGIGGIEWMEKGTHVHLELQHRGLGLPAHEFIADRAIIPDRSSIALGSRIRKVYPNGIPKSFTLFKYDKSKYLKPLLKSGELRLMPASSYDDPSLNVAVSDRELQFEKINYTQRVRYTSNFDFYCFCSSWLHSDRLISDFDADCVLVVKNPEEFFIRLATALDETDFKIDINKVTYIDPLRLGDRDVTHLAFAKHMRFAYQFEHRFVAMPTTDTKLDQRNLQLGPLENICELYES